MVYPLLYSAVFMWKLFHALRPLLYIFPGLVLLGLSVASFPQRSASNVWRLMPDPVLTLEGLKGEKRDYRVRLANPFSMPIGHIALESSCGCVIVGDPSTDHLDVGEFFSLDLELQFPQSFDQKEVFLTARYELNGNVVNEFSKLVLMARAK